MEQIVAFSALALWIMMLAWAPWGRCRYWDFRQQIS